jgi:hypothetical protein
MVVKSVLCLSKNHAECITKFCECPCHHQDSCDCFACKIKSIGFGDVPGGYKSTSGTISTKNKAEDF